MMKTLILGTILLVVSHPAAARSIYEQAPKRIYMSPFPVADVAQCFVARLAWYGPASMAPASEGNMRVQFASNGRVFTDLLLMAGPETKIEVRGVSGGRVRKAIEGCLQQPHGLHR